MLVLAAAPAFATTRYAEVSPGDGDPNVCAQADPCSIENAVEHASVANGDEVIVAPGTYDLGTGTVTVDNDIDLHGPAGGPRPKITTASTTSFTGAVTIAAPGGNGATVSDLELENTGASGAAGIFSVATGVVAERLVVTATQLSAACQVILGTVRDSVCRNTGNGSAILLTVGSTTGTLTLNLRNVTTVAQGSFAYSDGIVIFASGAGFNYVVDAKNTIALGGTFDTHAAQSGGATATINFENSNYNSVDPAGTGTVTPPGTGTGNQTALPVFVNQAAGNYHQAPSSPTFEAGASVSLLGAADFEGDARTVDGNCDGTATPDIGADELTPCPAPNNNFANAQILNGSAATVTGTNVTATEEPGEDYYETEDIFSDDPSVTRSVWYRWTSPGNGPATVDLCTANNYDTMLAVFTGNVLGSLTLVGANNNSGDCPPGSFASKVSFTASAGTTYQILVDGCCGLPHGNFTLNLVGPPIAARTPPSHDFGSRAVSAGPTAAQNITLSNSGGSNLTISSVALAGPAAGEFSKDDADCTGSGAGQANNLLAPGESCTVAVSFDPSSAGSKSATLDLATDGGNVSSNLSGTGTADAPPADTTAPETTITKGPKAKTKKKRASFEFSSSEAGSSFECKLDAAQFQPCASPLQVRVRKGKHTLAVRAIDAAGNPDATPASRTWKVKKKKKRR